MLDVTVDWRWERRYRKMKPAEGKGKAMERVVLVKTKEELMVEVIREVKALEAGAEVINKEGSSL